jgi:DNA-binding MarR family transcriptional regulator
MQDRVTELVLEIFRVHGEVIALGDGLVSDLQLTSARWQVMGAIALAEKPLPIAQIARNMGLTRQAVQRVANELEAEGFVRFAPNPDHQRAKLVLLTTKGQAAYAAAMKRWQPKARALGSGSTAKDIETALATLRRLRQRLAKEKR